MTEKDIERLQALDGWFDAQMDLSEKISSALNSLSRDKYHEKSFIYEFEPEVSVSVEADSCKMELKGGPSSPSKKKPKGTSFNSKLQSKTEFSQVIALVVEAGSAKAKLTGLLNQQSEQ